MKSVVALLFPIAIGAVAICLPAHAGVFLPNPDLYGSPALLQDYVSWDKAYTAFYADGSESRTYVDLVDIVYDQEVGRPWDDAYFPEAEKRLEAFRARLCPLLMPQPRLCSVPAKMATEQDVTALAQSLNDGILVQQLEKRWAVVIDPVTLPNANRSFDIEVGFGSRSSGSGAYWNLSPGTFNWFSMIPIVTDTDTYVAQFDSDDDFAGQFAFSGGDIVLNDWQIRDRAMSFANTWKLEISFNKVTPPTDQAADSEEIQYQALYDENQNLFQSYYAAYLPKVQGNPDFLARFQKERAQGDYPEEIYQHVAYQLLSDLVRIESGYYKLAETQRPNTSSRQKALEALLTLQRYSTMPRIFLTEWETLAMPFTTHAAVIDETADFDSVTTLSLEELNLILGLDAYANKNYFDRYKYAILADELFNADYLQANQPDIYKELLRPDGQLTKITELGAQDQLRLLRQYLTTTDGKQNIFGISRMSSVFRVRVRDQDLRDIADIVHAARSAEFH